MPSPAPSARSVRHTPSKGSVGGSGRRSGRRSGRAGSSRLHEDSPAGAGAGAGAGADSDNPATAGPAVDAAPSESASPSHFVTPAARLSRADKIDYTKSLNLRLYRKELLRIRGTLQDIVWRKYKGVRQLMAAFDKDGDGLINKTDWMKSCAETFPIDDGEARLMFEAIDDNGDGVLTYKELCDILEPSTMATFDPALASCVLVLFACLQCLRWWSVANPVIVCPSLARPSPPPQRHAGNVWVRQVQQAASQVLCWGQAHDAGRHPVARGSV